MLLFINAVDVFEASPQGAERFLLRFTSLVEKGSLYFVDATGTVKDQGGVPIFSANRLDANWFKLFDENYDFWGVLIEKLNPSHIYFGNLTGIGISPVLWALKRNIAYSMFIFDSWYVCPKSTLYRRGKLCDGLKSWHTCASCVVDEHVELELPKLFGFYSRITSLLSPLVLLMYAIQKRVFSSITKFNQRRNVNRNLLAGAECVFVLSETAKNLYKNQFLIKSNVHLIKTFSKFEGKTTVLPRVLGTRAKPVVGFVGRIGFHKGVDLLLKAVDELLEQSIELELCFAGSLEKSFESRLTQYKSYDRVSFLGYLSDSELESFYREIDLLVIPSRCPENRPQVLIDAVEMSVPVIVSSAPGMCEIVDSPDCQFELDNASNLAEQILHFLRSTQARDMKIFKENNTGISLAEAVKKNKH